MLYRIIYSSHATKPFSVEDAKVLLEDARGGNARCGVSGVLIYKDGVFFQVLEAEEAVLEQLIENISADARHRDMKIVRREAIPKRDFDEWRMAYLTPNEADLARWTGLEGATDIAAMVEHVRHSGAALPRVLMGIVDALAEQPPKAHN